MADAKILVVDDNDMVRSVAQQMLVALGYEAAVVDSGERALEEFSESNFDLILLDLDMPEMSGPELLRQLNEENVTIPVVLMSGHSNDRLATFGIDVAKITLVRKPFSPTSLVNLLKNILGKL